MISAIIPTRGGDERLARNLPSVRTSLVASGEPWEIIVVDDGMELARPPDGARIVTLSAAGGYGPAVNAGAQAATGDLLLILNDDVRLDPTSVGIMHEALAARGVFAVAPAILSHLAACGDEGGKAARWEAGLLEIEEVPATEPHATLYAVGCCYLCRRETFLGLGGYDDAYAPFFWEDVDLGYRAWRAGLASLHVPRAVCHHEGSATIGQRPMPERQRAWYRNRALFQLRNLRDPGLRAESLAAWAAHCLLDGRRPVEEGIADALARFAALGRQDAAGLSDHEILDRVRRG